MFPTESLAITVTVCVPSGIPEMFTDAVQSPERLCGVTLNAFPEALSNENNTNPGCCPSAVDLMKILSESEISEIAELTKGMKKAAPKVEKKKVELSDAEIAAKLQEQAKGKKKVVKNVEEEAYEEKELREKGEEMAKAEGK